jgi:hypothetical protein
MNITAGAFVDGLPDRIKNRLARLLNQKQPDSEKRME